ncbi:translation elongation factor eEF1 gamma [Metschnikowia bicuspidata var. bicuspidata NRRL YB-4993]|uniref:Translation elongation factor eEF1 gamma n=1 Tax=Metschnikowia bicuspidata var. bicuspidata NRRL YB-4993 TaxID=869754 RepID=A0A1A0HCN6_9ASCO|nr:translation elongation factor eEF1 gamma [Metschnikowia bicuspidata var. bicuspidata NRRL YB-4993]OBA21864.1 translation elongation factor eEF1 gamma [Metschnikowia bicuspidata var. bicuspidata NRRL YB-4993]
MSQGTLFADSKIRGAIPTALIKHFNLDVEIVEPESSAAFKKSFPLAKVPGFIGPKGVKLNEVIAISVYLLSLVEDHKLWGKNNTEYAEIFKWLSMTNSEFLPAAANVFKPLKGLMPYNKKQVDESRALLDKVTGIFEDRLSKYTFLVGERLTFADYFAAFLYVVAFKFLFGSEWRKQNPSITRWFKTVSSQALFKAALPEVEMCAKPIEYVPPKKEKKAAAPAAKKEAPKKEAAPAEAAPTEAPKPKHPLELLGKPKQALDEWKRIYSNEETRETAIPWFWKNMYDPSEWSLYKVDYKYNDELTLTFMSNNLVGGFFNRLSASTKYMFGCMVVYGENNNNGITGFFLVRGQDFAPAFDVAPDWESYAYTKLDGSDENVRKFVDNMLAWDEPVEVNGEKVEIADGKVFK